MLAVEAEHPTQEFILARQAYQKAFGDFFDAKQVNLEEVRKSLKVWKAAPAIVVSSINSDSPLELPEGLQSLAQEACRDSELYFELENAIFSESGVTLYSKANLKRALSLKFGETVKIPGQIEFKFENGQISCQIFSTILGDFRQSNPVCEATSNCPPSILNELTSIVSNLVGRSHVSCSGQ